MDQDENSNADKRSWRERIGINNSAVTDSKPKSTFADEPEVQKNPVRPIAPVPMAPQISYSPPNHLPSPPQSGYINQIAPPRAPLAAGPSSQQPIFAPPPPYSPLNHRPSPPQVGYINQIAPPRPPLAGGSPRQNPLPQQQPYAGQLPPREAASQPPQIDAAQDGFVKVVREEHPTGNGPIQKSVTQVHNSVFVIHGRDHSITDSLNNFLRSINLKPIEFSVAIRQTIEKLNKGGNPHISDILDAVFESAGALVVLFTGDDEVRLRKTLHDKREKVLEKTLNFQARPNVLFEAGMAYAKHPEKTIFLTVGKVKEFSDIAGRHMMYLDNSTKSRRQLALRLKSLGCLVDLDGDDWEHAGKFPK